MRPPTTTAIDTLISLMIELSATERASVVEHIAEMFCLSCGAPRKDRCACLRDELEELHDELNGEEWKAGGHRLPFTAKGDE